MTWKDVPPGVYAARVTDYGLEEIEKLNNAIKVVIMLDVVIDPTKQPLAGKWDGFIATKDGMPNAKTMKTLAVCGMKSDDIMDLAIKPDMLNTSRDLEVQVVRDGDYMRIEWINLVGGMASIKKTTPKVRPGAQFKAALAEARRATGPANAVVNHAAKFSEPSFDDASEIPF